MKRAPRGVWFALALLLPIVGYVGAIAFARARIDGAPIVEIAVSGYDPRDPVRGHYVLYRVNYELRARVESSLDEFGIPWDADGACLARDGYGRHVVVVHDDPDPRCELDFPLEFVRAPHRFYVEQGRADELGDLVARGRATIRVALVSPKRAVVQSLLVDGRPWEGVVFDLD